MDLQLLIQNFLFKGMDATSTRVQRGSSCRDLIHIEASTWFYRGAIAQKIQHTCLRNINYDYERLLRALHNYK